MLATVRSWAVCQQCQQRECAKTLRQNCFEKNSIRSRLDRFDMDFLCNPCCSDAAAAGRTKYAWGENSMQELKFYQIVSERSLLCSKFQFLKITRCTSRFWRKILCPKYFLFGMFASGKIESHRNSHELTRRCHSSRNRLPRTHLATHSAQRPSPSRAIAASLLSSPKQVFKHFSRFLLKIRAKALSGASELPTASAYIIKNPACYVKKATGGSFVLNRTVYIRILFFFWEPQWRADTT
jgi:hypothetical protein